MKLSFSLVSLDNLQFQIYLIFNLMQEIECQKIYEPIAKPIIYIYYYSVKNDKEQSFKLCPCASKVIL